MERIYYITQVAVGLLICFSVVSAQGEGSCVGRCGEGYFRGHSCHCDYNCMSYMECCRDFKAVCTTENSCRGRCHEGFIRGQACDCDPNCLNYGKCCPDYDSICAKPIQRRSPAPRPPEERGNLPDKEQDTEKEQDKVPQEPDQDSTTPPPNVITPQPVKEKKQPPKKPKIPKKKPKKLVETEEDIEETEENETSSMFSTTRTKGTTIKRTRKDPKKKKPKDKKLNPKANATEPIKESFTPSLPPPPDNNENALMTPQTPRVGDDIEDPNGSKEDSTDNPPSSTTPKTAKKRSPPKTNKKEINKNQEKDELTKQSNKKKPSPEDIKGKEKTNPKGEKKDPSKGPDTSEKKQIKKPVSRGPRKRIIKNFLEDDTEEPSKIVNKKKPPPKDINRKKKVDSKEERQEIVESEFTNSSQSSSSRRRSKSTTRRMSENNKDVKNKNNKKIPDVKPLIPPKRKKDKDFLRTPEPTPRDEGSGDDGSGMVFLQTTPSTTSLPTSLPKETFYSTETPKPLSTDEHSLKTTPVMNIFTDLSSASTDKTKEPFKQTENPAQPTEDSTSKATANDENNVRTSIALTSRPVNETSTDPSQNVGSISKQPQITTSSDTVTSFYRNIDKTTLVHTNNPLTDEERAGNQKGNTGDSRITVENSTIIKWTPYTTQSMTTEEMDKNTPLFEEANKDGLLIYPTVSSQNMENFTLLPTEIKIQQTTASTEGSINDGLTTTHSESKNSSFSAETVFTDMSTTILTTLRMSPSMSHPETSKISRGISTTDSTVTRVTDNVSGFVLPSEPDGNNPPMVSKEYTDRTTTVVLTSVSNSIGQSSDNNLSGHTEQLYTAYALNITSTEITQSGQSSPTNEVPKTAVQEPTQVPADSSALVTVETSPDHLVGSSLPTVDAPQSLSPAQENSTRQSHSSTMNRGLNGELASTVAKQPSEIHTGDIVTPGYIDYIHSKLPTQSSSSSSNLDITEQTASTTEHSSHTYKSTTVKENESRPAVTQTPQKDHSEIAVSATDTRTEVIYSTHSTQSTEQSTLTKEAPLSTALNKDIDKGYTNLLDTKGSEAPTEASTMITQQLNTNNIFSPTVTVNLGHKTSINEATSEQAIVNTPETKQSITDMPKTVPNERNTEGMVSVKTPNSAFVEPTQWQHTDQSSKAPQPVELNEERIHSSTGDTIEDHAVSVEDIGSAASHSTSSANAVTSDTNTLGAIILSTLSSDKTTQTEMQKASITRTTQLPIDLVGSSLPTVDAPQSLSPAQENSTRQSQSSTITMYRGLNGELASTVAKQPSEIHTGDTVTPGYIDYIHSKVPTQSSSSSNNLDITEQTASTTEHSSNIYKSTTVKENESRPAVTQTPQKDQSEIPESATDTRTEVIYSTHSTQSTEQSTLTKEAHLSTVLNKDIDKGYTNLLDTKGSEAPTDASTMNTQQINTNNILSPTVTVNLGHKTSINEATSEQAIVNTPETKQSLTDMPKTVPNERNTEGMVSVKTPDSAFVEPTQWQHTDQSSKAPQPVELNGDTIADHAVSVKDIGSAASHSTSSANTVTSKTNTLGAIILSTLSSDKTEMQKTSISGTTQLPIDTSLSVTVGSKTGDLSSHKILDTTPNIHTLNQHTSDSKVDVFTDPNIVTEGTTSTGGQESSSAINKTPDVRPMVTITEASQIPEITTTVESTAPLRENTSPAMTLKKCMVTTEEQKIDQSPAASFPSEISEKPRSSETDVPTEIISMELATRDTNDLNTISDVVTEGALTSNFRLTMSVPEITENPPVVVKTETGTKSISVLSTASLKPIDAQSIGQVSETSYPTDFPQKSFTAIAGDGISGTSPIIVTGQTNKDINKLSETVPNLETTHDLVEHFETVTNADRTLNIGKTPDTPDGKSLNRSASEEHLSTIAATGNSLTFGITASQMPNLANEKDSTVGVSTEQPKTEIWTTSTRHTISSTAQLLPYNSSDASTETMLDTFRSSTASLEQTRAVTEELHEGQTSPENELTTHSSASYTDPIIGTSLYKEVEQKEHLVTDKTNSDVSSSDTSSPASSTTGTLTNQSSFFTAHINTDQKSPETSTITSKEHHIIANSTVKHVPTILDKTSEKSVPLTTGLVETTRGNIMSSLFTDGKEGKSVSPTIGPSKVYTSSLKADLETSTENIKESTMHSLSSPQSSVSTGKWDENARDTTVYTTSTSIFFNEFTTLEPKKTDVVTSNASTESYPPSNMQKEKDHPSNTPIMTDVSSVPISTLHKQLTKYESPVAEPPELSSKHAGVPDITFGPGVLFTNISATEATDLTRLSSHYTINTPESTTETIPKLSSGTTEVNTSLEDTFSKSTNNLFTPSFGFSVNAVTTLQEQSTPDNKTNDNSHTTSSEGLQTSTSSMLNSSTSIGQTNEPSSSIVRNMYDTPNQTSTVEYSTLKLSEKKNVSSGHSTVFFTTQTIVSVPTSNAVESKENSTSPEGTYGYSSPTPGQKTEDLPTSKPQLTSSDVNISGNRTFADIKETTTTSSTTQPMESVSTTTQVNVASLQSTVKSSEKEDNTTKEVTTKPLLTEQQTNNPSVSSGHSTVFFTTQTIVSVPTSNAVESKENSSSTEGTHGYSSLTPGQKTEDLPTSKPQLTSSDNTSGNRTFVDIKKTTTTSSTTQPMKSVSTTTQENVASLQSTVKSSEKEDNTTKEVTTKPLLTEQQTNNPSISSGHSTVFFTTQTIVSVPTSNAVESKENSSSTEGTHGYSSPTPGQKTEDLPTSKPQLTSSDVNTSGNRTFVDIKETTTTSSTTQPIKSVSTTTQVNVASLQSTVKSSEKEDNTTKEVTTKPLLTEQQTNNPSVSSGHSTVFFTTQTIVSVPTSNAVESKENSSSTEGTHGYSSPTPGQKTEDLPTSKPQLTSSDNTSGNRTFVDIKETTTTSSTTQPMKSVSTTTQVNVASLQSTVKSSEKEDNTTKEGTTKPLLTEQQTNNPSVSSGHSTVFFTTQTIVSVPTSNAVESKENSSSTEGTHGYSSPTPGQKTEDLPTSKPQLTSSDVNTSGNRTFVDIKETTTTSSDTQPMKSVSTTTQVNVASLQSTVKSSEKQDNTTKGVTNKPLIREQQTKNPSVSSFPKSTVKYDVEKRPTVPKSDNRNTSSSRVISVEQMENKYNANPPHSLDHFSICEMLLDKENKLGISESDLQLIRKICMEIHSNFTSVSTPSSETKLPSQNPSDSPPKHFTTQSRVDQPNEKLLPNKTIIQIVEEISRKHLLFPSHKTNKSAAWILLLKKIRSPQDPQMNLCNGQPVNGMTTLQNGSMVVFRGHYFWTLNQGGAVRQARKISDVWGIPSPVDTVFTRCNCAGKTFFIKGPQYWRFTNDVMDKGYPKEISTGFGGLKGKVTAVLSVAGFKTRPESVYFFKGGGNVQKYTFRQEQSKRCTKKRQPTVQYPIYSHNIQTVKYRYPRDIQKQQRNIQRTVITIKQEPLGILHQEISVRSTWRGIPNSIVSAISLPNSHKPDGFDYFVFSKEKYYNINITSKVAVKPPPNSEQKISKDWYKCKE
ncbi:mucin-12-like isoform X1 [Xenopus laevis]|uniref:Mucin-12-like isoform X1 n=1 Tax=Xenopus laevis TaxID=8355 RepID=A0A8J1MXM8_XENLA|nr:mucin-12-like isoform X1 [Xenopus laevis]